MDTFGLRSAPKIFLAVADALEWILQQARVTSIMHYLDDYLAPAHCQLADNEADKGMLEQSTAVKPAVQLLQIQEVHPVAHSSACNFCRFLSIFLTWSSFTSRTPNKDQKTEQLFYVLLVQVPSPGDIHELRGKCFCACYSQALTKSTSCKKWGI